jgi:hypothetical protein
MVFYEQGPSVKQFSSEDSSLLLAKNPTSMKSKIGRIKQKEREQYMNFTIPLDELKLALKTDFSRGLSEE